MAVPHRGSNYAGFGKIASNIVGLVTFQQKNSFLQSVSIDSDYNKELNSKFEPLLKLYKFYTWMEGREVPGVGLFPSSNDAEWKVLSGAISEAARDAMGSISYTPTLDRSYDMIGELRHEGEFFCQFILMIWLTGTVAPYAQDLLGAISEAQVVIDDMHTFCHSTELQSRDCEAGVASDVALSLAKLLLAVMSPILSLSSSSNVLTAIAALLLNSILAVLPSKSYLLEKVEEGQEAEEAIMKAEKWAIDNLNGSQRAALRSGHSLKQKIAALELQEIDDAQVPLLVQARLLQGGLQTLVERNTQDIHERRVKYERAKRIVTRTEEVRHKVEDKTKKETYMVLNDELRKEQQNPDSDDESGCC
ncbi:hypothetical protein CEK27_010268 [Fusarium fujikuroi]|nr:hypothetical protein CEK27_010268 [Fusarium fujikuroi]QGI83541.1 hypothetical protein CEK25_010270 [Fusarium fujikuroi]